MIFSHISLTCVLLSSAAVFAQNYTISDIPTCPLSCLIETISASKCSLLDTQCQCNDEALFEATAHCVLAKCSLSDDIKLSRVQASICDRPKTSRAPSLCHIISIMLTVVTFTSILRLLSCWRVKGGLFVEDYIIITGLFTTYAVSTLVFKMINNGFGDHIYQIVSDKAITNILLYFWVAELVYILQIFLIKISIVFCFLRIFPQRNFRYACYGLITFMTVTAILWMFLILLQCHPFSSNWNINIIQPKCQAIQMYAYVGAGVTMLDDIMLLVFPIPLLLRLQITLKQKFAVMALFSLGIFVLITSAIRIRYVSTLGNSADPTWDNVDITIWTALEIDVSLLCANMPAIAGLVTHYHRKFFPSSSSTLPSNTSPMAELKPTWTHSNGDLSTPEECLRHTPKTSASDLDLEHGVLTISRSNSIASEAKDHIYGVNETIITSSPRKPHIANLIVAEGYEKEMERKRRLREREMGSAILVSRSVIVREERDDRSSIASSRVGLGVETKVRSGSHGQRSLHEMFEPWPGEEC